VNSSENLKLSKNFIIKFFPAISILRLSSVAGVFAWSATSYNGNRAYEVGLGSGNYSITGSTAKANVLCLSN
jgi:hypothetical protein